MKRIGDISIPFIPRNRLREFRVIPHISQWKLALCSGIKQSRISLIENLLVKPTIHEKEKLAKALKCPLKEIFPNHAKTRSSK